ncbi:MAG: RagB/SusD family nutrient uptake outer membrane protein [Fermentimonas sp.]|jgi:hypothetical protein
MKKYIYLLTSVLLLLSSCNYLDVEPGDTITEDRFWSTANGVALEQYCHTYYPSLVIGHGNPNSWDPSPMIAGDLQSDNLLSGGANQIAYGKNVKSHTDGAWRWSVIRGCNAFLENYMRSPASPSEKRHYAGEIYFFKAWDYFNKMKRFGDVPWYDKVLDKKDPGLYKKRDSRVLVTDSILMCLDRAIEYLPKQTDVCKVSKDAALLLKARVCLYEGTWRRYRDMDGDEELLKIAYETAGELMKNEYGHSLYIADGTEMSYFNLFIKDNYNGNSEIILSREYDPSVNMGHQISRQYPMSNYGMSRDCFEEYLCSKTGKPISICGCHNPHMGYLAEMMNRDKRLLQTVCVPDPNSPHAQYLYRKDGNSVKGGAPNIFNLFDGTNERPFYGASVTGYCVSKFYKTSEWEGNEAFKGSVDAPVMRYAEVLLIRAEAGAELGLDPELDKTINALRRRVGFPFDLTTDPIEDPDLVSKYPDIKGPNANLIREIRRERRIELFAEGYRWDDLCRWRAGVNLLNRERRGAIMDPKFYSQKEINMIKEKIGFDNDGFITPYAIRVTYKPSFTEKNYLFNIPIEETSLNPNLLPDNPGW